MLTREDAREIGQRLDYADRDKRLVTRLRAEWSGEAVEDRDYVMLSGDDLAALKGPGVPAASVVPQRTSALMLLLEPGLALVLIARRPARPPLSVLREARLARRAPGRRRPHRPRVHRRRDRLGARPVGAPRGRGNRGRHAMTTPPTAGVVRVERATLRAVRFRGERSRSPVPWEGPVLDLVGAKHLDRVEKKGTPAFSAVEYEEGASRGKRGILHATVLVLDFDHLKTEAADQVLRRLQARGWAHVACTSWSHQAGGPDDCCFRVLVLVSRPILPDEYEAVWVAANGALDRQADANARDVSRIWYVASCPPERADRAWVRAVDGRPLDVDWALATSTLKPPARRKKADDSSPLAEGERNAGLVRIGGALRRKGAGRDELLAALHAANAARCQPPLGEDEVAGIVDSLLRYDPASPLVTLNLTDAGNAERFIAHAGHRFAFVHAWGSWLHYDGVRWQRDGDGEALRAALATVRATATEAEKAPDDDHRGELLRHALDSESSARLAAMLSVAQVLQPVGSDALDRDPDLLNVQNGTLDLRTGELRPHGRDDWLTRLAPVPWEPEDACPRWEAFLHRVMGGNDHLVAFLQRAVGYSLTGHTTEQVLFLLHGVRANGKSTFLETLRALLADCSAITDFTTFLRRDSEGVSTPHLPGTSPRAFPSPPRARLLPVTARRCGLTVAPGGRTGPP